MEEFDKIVKRIKPVSKIKTKSSFLFYGKNGSGKTSLAATFPKPLLLLDCNEEGTDPIRLIEGIDVISIHKWEDFVMIYWYLKSGNHTYKTAVIDTVSQVQELAMKKVKVDNDKEENVAASRKDYGETASLLKPWFMDFRDLKMVTVFLAYERTFNQGDDDPDGEEDSVVGPALMPSIAGSLNASVKVVGHTYIKGVIKQREEQIVTVPEFRLRLAPSERYITKIRIPKGSKVPEYIKNPTCEKIKDILYPEKREEK